MTPLSSLHDGEGSSVPGCVPPNDMVNYELVMDVKPGDSGVMTGYQVDEVTHTWLAECFIAQSHIYPSFTVRMSTLTHFPLEPGCENYSFWTKQSQTLSMVLILSSWTLSTYQNWMHPLIRLMCAFFSLFSIPMLA